MPARDAMEHHERTTELPHVTANAKRIAVIVAVLAALLAVTEVYAENRVTYVLKDETKIAHLNVTIETDEIAGLLGKPHGDPAVVRTEVAGLEAHQASATTAHQRLEFAVVLLELAIVLTSISALLAVRHLLSAGVAVGLAGAGFLMAGLLA